MIKNIRHAGIVVFDLDATLVFYEEYLGMKITANDILDKKMTTKLLGISTSLHYIKLVSNDDTGCLIELYYFTDEMLRALYLAVAQLVHTFNHIAVTVENVDAVYLKLDVAGIKCLSTPITSTDKKHKLFFARDPSNNLLEIVERIKE